MEWVLSEKKVGDGSSGGPSQGRMKEVGARVTAGIGLVRNLKKECLVNRYESLTNTPSLLQVHRMGSVLGEGVGFLRMLQRGA
ncbi:MAG: hypothetical protein AB3X41_04545 [Leptothrix ochracea]|uniref:hypothetical protein n=1 Tax=Leptothrix ochracea TaxID=735331 RepID=UPI0034E1C22A